MVSVPVLIAGHYCHDTLYLADGTCSAALGGSVSYISSVLSALKLKYQVVSKVGSDFAYFSKILDSPQVIPAARTTHFVADFSQGERTAHVSALCDPIYPEDIPLDIECDLALAVGIVGEILPETLDRLAQGSRLLLCDIQGMIRTLDSQGRVGYRQLENTPFFSRLHQVSYLKASRQEAQFMNLEKVRTRTHVLVTEGKDGCTFYGPSSEFRIPAYPAQEIDPTGAGDCFLAGFAAGLLGKLPLEKAVLMGNYFGALAVGQIGVPQLLPMSPDGLTRLDDSLKAHDVRESNLTQIDKRLVFAL
jgi:1D-myo-inositol 3-kinase